MISIDEFGPNQPPIVRAQVAAGDGAGSGSLHGASERSRGLPLAVGDLIEEGRGNPSAGGQCARRVLGLPDVVEELHGTRG